MNDTAAAIPAFIDMEDESVLANAAKQDIPDIPRESPRYVFYANDTIDPRRKQKAKRLRWGGDELEIDYKCFGITRGILWRNMFVPMTLGYDYLDPTMVRESDMGNLVERWSPPNPNNPYEPRLKRTMVALPRYPGEEIQALLYGTSQWPNMGLVEIKALRKMEWADFKKEGIQTFFFPDWERYRTGELQMPFPLSWTRKRIDDAAKSTSDSFLRSIAEDCMVGIELSYHWGIEYLKRETKLVKTPPAPGSGYVMTYSHLAEQLFEFLEQDREDYLRNKDITPFDTSHAVPDLKEVLDKISSSQAMIAEILARTQTPGAGDGVAKVPDEIKEQANQIATAAAEIGVVPEEELRPNLCQGIRNDGEPCGAPPIKGTKYCTWHAPAQIEEEEE